MRFNPMNSSEAISLIVVEYCYDDDLYNWGFLGSIDTSQLQIF